MDVGAKLKESRLAQGLSLDQLQEITKIQKRYLVAIEEGNLDILPGKFYARAFIKEYANAVGLDSSELLEEHKEEIPKSEEESDLQYTRIEGSRKEANAERNTSFSLIPTIIVVLLIIGILLVAWFFIKEDKSDDANSPEEALTNNEVILKDAVPEPEITDDGTVQNDDESDAAEDEEDTSTNEDTENADPSLEFVVVEEGSGTVPESTLELNNPGDELIFTFESVNDVWLDVENGAGESFYKNR